MSEQGTAAPSRVAPMLEGYDGLKFALPNGRMVVGKVLPLDRVCYYRRLAATTETDTPAMVSEKEEKIMAEFPKEVGLEAEFNQLTYAEFWDAYQVFFARRVTPAETNGKQHPTPIGATS